jgi:hypothetical protein
MRYGTALQFRQALDMRLRARAREASVPLLWLRKQVAFDRLLARLLVVGGERWLLKGALALDYRLSDRARTSRDMDLAHGGGEFQATADLRRAAALDLGDFFSFDVKRTSRLDESVAGAAVRYHLDCRLGRTLFDASTVDVGFTDRLDLEVEVLSGPALLGFAGIEPVAVPALPLCDHVAQKVHAWASQYGRDHPSSRSKDLADLVILAESFSFDAGHLREALERTFGARGAGPVPAALPPPPETWQSDYRRVASRLGLDADVDAACQVASAFVDPVLATMNPTGTWDTDRQEWTLDEEQLAVQDLRSVAVSLDDCQACHTWMGVM